MSTAAVDKPKSLPVNANGIPTELKARDQWVAWRVEHRDGKPTKVPYDPFANRQASSTDRNSTRLNSIHIPLARMPSSAC